jgi:hypothetical protein
MAFAAFIGTALSNIEFGHSSSYPVGSPLRTIGTHSQEEQKNILRGGHADGWTDL